jgi:hypothetical protein
MGTPEAFEIGPGALERTDRVGREVAGHRPVEPERLPLVSVESRLRADPTCEGFDLASPHASLLRAALAGEHTRVTQVNDMLT